MEIRVQGLIKAFDNPDKPVLKGLDVEIEPGQFVSITGRSGSGKSTFLYCVSGLDTVSSGTVTIGGRNIHTMSQAEVHRFRNQELGFVFQFHYLLPELTALENVLMPARKVGLHDSMQADALRLMEQFEVDHARDRKPAQMSGGEQQRVAIARALISQPACVLLDEPTGNLDQQTAESIQQLMLELSQTLQTAFLVVTHDLALAARMDRTFTLKHLNNHRT